MTENARTLTLAVVRLREWMRQHGYVRPNGALDTRRLAEKYMRQTGPAVGVRQRHTPPYAGMLGIVEGRTRPRHDTRQCLEDLTDGFVKILDWDSPAE